MPLPDFFKRKKSQEKSSNSNLSKECSRKFQPQQIVENGKFLPLENVSEELFTSDSKSHIFSCKSHLLIITKSKNRDFKNFI